MTRAFIAMYGWCFISYCYAAAYEVAFRTGRQLARLCGWCERGHKRACSGARLALDEWRGK